MKLRMRIFRVGLSIIFLCAPGAVASADAPALQLPAVLALAEIKMTGDEFIVVTNNSGVDIPDTSSYWLYHYNKSNPQTAGATTTTQQLPAGPLAAGASLLLSGGGTTCGAQAAAKLSLSLSDSAGSLQLLASTPAGLILPAPIDQVSWSSGSGSADYPIDITGVPSSTKDKQAAYYRTAGGAAFDWQQADVDVDQVSGTVNICELDVMDGEGAAVLQAINPADNQLLPPGEAPAIIVSLAAPDAPTGPSLPRADIGLQAPQITELLPNPAGAGTDGTDEFIELYNSNTVPFDLSGFTLETGMATKHKYTFPAGTLLPPAGFIAFYSADTRLSLSNTSGQADLLDPFGTVIAQTDTYGSAKDGTAWALAKGVWYWTNQPTPSAANVINQASASIKTTSASKAAAAVKGAATAKSPLQGQSSSATTTQATDTGESAPVHPLVLAAIAALAVGYGVYEYRHDLGNAVHQFRSNRAARRAARK